MAPPPPLTPLIFLGGAVLLGGVTALWVYYDRRDRRWQDAERRKVTFHCIRCDTIHAELVGTETAVCPQCGQVNARLKF